MTEFRCRLRIAPAGWPPKPAPEQIEEMEQEFGRARVIADE